MATVSPSWNCTLHLPHDPRAPGTRAAVWDTGRRVLPAVTTDKAPAAPDAEDGRGLHLTRACADATDVSVLRELGASKGGKLLWAERGVPGW